MILRYDLGIEDSKPTFSSSDDAQPCLVVKGSAVQKIPLGKHSLAFFNFAVTLTLNTASQFLHKTFWLMIMYHQTKIGSKQISSSEDTVEAVMF